MKGIGAKRNDEGRSARFILKIFSAMLVLGLCAFGVARMSGTVTAADCGPSGLLTAPPRALRAAARGAWTTEAVAETNGKFVVTKPEQLAWVAEQVNAGANDFAGKTISIEADLDLGANEWVPIGGASSGNAYLKGSFVGNGHTISNMRITMDGLPDNHEDVGLIGRTTASVSGLHLRGVNIDLQGNKSGATYVGMLAGTVMADAAAATVSDCTAQGTIAVDTARGATVGGLVGQASGNSATVVVANCHVLAGSVIQGNIFTGGVVGEMSTAQISGCTFFGDRISSASDAGSTGTGGIVAVIQTGGSVDGCVASSDVSAKGGDVGGIVARLHNANTSITNCAAYGKVSGASVAVGGILGHCRAFSASYEIVITNCTNAAAVTNNLGDVPLLQSAAVGYDGNWFSGTGGVVGLIGNPTEDGTVVGVSIASVSNSGTVAIDGSPHGHSGSVDPYYVTAGGLIGAAFGRNNSGSGTRSVFAVRDSANRGDVSIAGTFNNLDKYSLYAGGLAGKYYVRGTSVSYANLTMERSYNAAGISISQPQTSGAYAGGLIGHSSNNDSLSRDPDLADCYNAGSIAAQGTDGYAGGLVGYQESPKGSWENCYSYAANVAGQYRGGLVASLDLSTVNYTSVFYLNVVDLNDSGLGVSADHSRNASNLAAAVSTWPNFNSTGSMPLGLRYDNIHPAGIVARAAVYDVKGAGDVKFTVLPHADIRSSAAVTYAPAGDWQTYFSSYTPTADGLTLTAKEGVSGIVKLTVAATVATLDLPLSRDVFVRVVPPDTIVKAFYINNLPLTPTENETRDVWLTWHAADDADTAAPRSADELPAPLPEVTWSVAPPTGGGNWDVSIAPDSGNPLRAKLTIGSKTGSSLVTREQYQVTAHMKQEGGVDETSSRTFYVGTPFPTQVDVSTQVQSLIDAANAILARTGVMIVPGNHQPPIPQHILDMIAMHLRDNLVTYAATESRAASGDLADLYVLTSLDQIEQMRVEQPDSASLPECFVATDKDSANIILDLNKLTDPNAAGKLVILPMTYAVKIESDDMRDFYGADADAIAANPSAYLDRIFEVLVLHKRIKEGAMLNWYTRLVNGIATPQEAHGLGMLLLEGNAAEGSLTVSLGYNVLNYHGESFTVQGNLQADGSGLDVGYIVLPDGLENEQLIDPLWTNRWTTSGGSGSSGGGGGCAAGATLLPALLALCALAYRRKK